MVSERWSRSKAKLKKAHEEFKIRNATTKVEQHVGVFNALPETAVSSVPLTDIDLEDRRFQWRLDDRHDELRRTLEADGQQYPIVLWGKRPPYIVVDGFRRLGCAQKAGWDNVKAIIRNDIPEPTAFKLAFIENVKRKNLSPLDCAHAIWSAMNRRGMAKHETADVLGLSVRQVERYIEMVSYSEDIQKALLDKTITMAHAVILSKLSNDELKQQLNVLLDNKMSARELKKSLAPFLKGGRPKKYWQRFADGFRLYPCKLTSKSSPEERGKIKEMLQAALALLEQEPMQDMEKN